MNPQLHHWEIEELLGAYALDAVAPEERALIDRHLASCPACQTEVSAHQRVIASLAPAATAPPELWDGITSKLEEAPPLELAPVIALANRRSRSVRLLAAVTAVAAAAVVVLGVRLVDQGRRLDRMQTAMADVDLQQVARAAIADPAATKVNLRSPNSPAAAQVAVFPDGRGYLLADDLPPLAPGRTYQLWALVDGEPISAGTLGTKPETAAFHLSGPVAGFAVTEEKAPGVVASKNAPILIGRLRSD